MNGSFSFDYHILESCATERTASRPLRNSSDTNQSSACQDLYHAYSRHYRREFSEDRFRRFQEMVQLLYNHNSNDNTHKQSYYLTLNQFSDDPSFPVANTSWQEKDDDSDLVMWKNQLRPQGQVVPNFTPLDDEWKIRRRGLTGHHHKYHPVVKKKKKADQSPPTLSWHYYVSDQPFNVIDLPKKGTGVEIDLKPTNYFHNVDSNVDDADADKFAKSLNWATKHNPDKVRLVHDVFDQVRENISAYSVL
jgi:hypothetical protein